MIRRRLFPGQVNVFRLPLCFFYDGVCPCAFVRGSVLFLVARRQPPKGQLRGRTVGRQRLTETYIAIAGVSAEIFLLIRRRLPVPLI